MKKRSKLLATMLVFALTISTVGCGNSSTPKETAPSAAAVESANEEKANEEKQSAEDTAAVSYTHLA